MNRKRLGNLVFESILIFFSLFLSSVAMYFATFCINELSSGSMLVTIAFKFGSL